MISSTETRKSFFISILSSFRDLDASIREQIELRKKERQLLPLVYYSCFILLLSQIARISNEVQQEPYLSVIVAVIVANVFFLPIFLYIFSFIIHWILNIFGSVSTIFITRLALFWSLTISTVIILIASILKLLVSGSIELAIVIISELFIIYIFSRMISFVSCFKDRNLFTLIVTSIYLIPVIFVNFS